MKGQVLKGQLTYADTESDQIEITDMADGEVTALNIDAQTRLPAPYGWESLLGENVEATVIDGKTKNVCLLTQE
jgi:hypothetical protein